MSETAMVVTAQRYSQGFTYEGYLNQLGDTRQRFAEHSAAFPPGIVGCSVFQRCGAAPWEPEVTGNR